MKRIIVKVKKKELVKTDSKWLDDRVNLENVHRNISPLIPLPKENAEQINTGSWFNIQKINNKNSNYKSVFKGSDLPKSNKGKNESLRTIFYTIQLDKQMEQIFKQTCHLTRFLYNQCVKECHKGFVTDKGLRDLLINSKTNKFRGTKYEELLEKIPYDIKREVIRDFFKGFNTQKKLAYEKKRPFEMKYRKKNRDQNFVLNKKHIKFISDYQIESYPTYWPKDLIFKQVLPDINHDCRVVWTRSNRFCLMVSLDKVLTPNLNSDVCALDPGVRTFQTTFDTQGISYQIGSGDYYSKIEPLINIAQRMRDGNKRDFVEGKRIFRSAKNSKEKKGLKRAALRVEQKISNLLLELRRKTVNFLCSRYKSVIIPKFETQRMCQKRNSNGIWVRKVGKKTAEGLSRLSHYQFQQLLIAKGKQTGTKIIIGHERSSTKTCTNCLALNNSIGGSERFDCSECGMSFGRDIQAARNILLINWDQTEHSMVKKPKFRIHYRVT